MTIIVGSMATADKRCARAVAESLPLDSQAEAERPNWEWHHRNPQSSLTASDTPPSTRTHLLQHGHTSSSSQRVPLAIIR